MKKSSKKMLYLTMIVLIISIAILVGIIVEKSYNKMKIAEKSKAEQLTQVSGDSSYIDTNTHLAEVENAYNNGYSEGYAAGQNNAGEIEYTYHTHGDGYCNQTPVYHQHTGQSGSCYSPNYCGGQIRHNTGADGNSSWYTCKRCGAGASSSDSWCTKIVSYSLVCQKTTSTIDSYKCTVAEGSIVSATIKFK